MFTKLYLETTDPKLSLNDFLSVTILFMIIISVMFHTLLYAGFCNLAFYIFYGKLLNRDINIRLTFSLILIMLLGYIGRFIHAKEVYADFNYNYEKTKQYLEMHYNSWIFLG